MNGRFVSYLRVSGGPGQTSDGLGVEAQRRDVARFLNGGDWRLMGEFVEVESGADNDRPALAEALRLCRLTNSTLVVAKLDRLSRDAHFLFGLEKAGVEFVCADNPHANRLTARIMAVVAEDERERIAARTRGALQAAKARGVALGGWRGGPKIDPALGRFARTRRADLFAAEVGPEVEKLRSTGASLREIARTMSERGIRTPGGGAWTGAAVRSLLARHDRLRGQHLVNGAAR